MGGERRLSVRRYQVTLPMVAFILPCIFIVVAGPAGIRLMAAFN